MVDEFGARIAKTAKSAESFSKGPGGSAPRPLTLICAYPTLLLAVMREIQPCHALPKP